MVGEIMGIWIDDEHAMQAIAYLERYNKQKELPLVARARAKLAGHGSAANAPTRRPPLDLKSPAVRRAAAHEAGHCLLAETNGVPVLRAWVTASGDGGTVFDADVHARSTPWNRACIVYAGPWGEAIIERPGSGIGNLLGDVRARADRRDGPRDIEALADLTDEIMRREGLSYPRAVAQMSAASVEAKAVLNREWRALSRLADALARAGDLTGAEVRRLLGH